MAEHDTWCDVEAGRSEVCSCHREERIASAKALCKSLCDAYAKGEQGTILSASAWCAMSPEQQQCYNMGAQRRRELMR